MAINASINAKEIEMKTIKPSRIVAAMSAVALVAALAGPALAQTPAHSHDGAEPHTLSLNQGKKWATDEPLREGMARIRILVEPRLSAAHAGKLTAVQYRQLATQVEAEVGAIVANCKLEPEADAMLHLLIADLGAGTDAMAGKNPKLRPAPGLVKIAQTINAYGSHFDHPGFAPIHDLH